MKTATINLYSFDELTDKAKEKALYDHRYFLLEIMTPEDFISGCEEYDTPEELQKTYEAEYDYYLMNDEPIQESIEANEYLFYYDGTLAHCTTYTGKHPDAGKTDLRLYGETYDTTDSPTAAEIIADTAPAALTA